MQLKYASVLKSIALSCKIIFPSMRRNDYMSTYFILFFGRLLDIKELSRMNCDSSKVQNAAGLQILAV